MKYQSIVFIFSFCTACVSSELITLSAGWFIGSAVLGGGWYKWDTVKENTYCRFAECCNADYVPYELTSEYINCQEPVCS